MFSRPPRSALQQSPLATQKPADLVTPVKEKEPIQEPIQEAVQEPVPEII